MAELAQYHVLKQVNAQGAIPTFQLVGRDLNARDGDQAIRIYAEKAAGAGSDEQQESGELVAGVYIAVPARSWNPKKVAAEVQTVIRLGGDA